MSARLMRAGTLLSALPLMAAFVSESRAASCAERAPAFSVVAEHHPPTVQSSYSSDELLSLATKSGLVGRHPPLGFYAGTFGYALDFAEVGQDGAPCRGTVTVRMFLARRVVEVAADSPCRPQAVAAHYGLHARKDDLLLSRYAAFARTMLDGMVDGGAFSNFGTWPRDVLMRSVSAAMDDLLQPYDRERKEALASADTEEELAQLAKACGNAT